MHDLSRFAVIATCFNPIGYQTRYDLYRKFEEHMLESGVVLFTVECLFESTPIFGLPKQNFEVTQSDNPRHFQLVAPSILWMKENMINIAVRNLPNNIEYVAWIDSDIEFTTLDWPHIAMDQLQIYPIVQLFESARFLGPNGKNEILRHDHSFAYSIKHEKPIDPRRYNEWYPHPGYGWAMRRSAFNRIGGLCEFSILGSGDLHLAFALLNRIRETIPKDMSDDYRQTALAWGDRVANLSANGTQVGYVPVHIYHHWHGNRNDRAYVDRWRVLERHRFEPSRDLVKNPQTGVIGLKNRRHENNLQMSIRLIALERDIVAYFTARKEDNKQTITIPSHPVSTTQKHKPVSRVTAVPHSSFRPSASSSHHQLWTSGPSGHHVDYEDHMWVTCTCQYHHNFLHDEDCPCYIHYNHCSESPDRTDQEHEESSSSESSDSDHEDDVGDNHDDDANDNHDADDNHEEPEPGSFY